MDGKRFEPTIQKSESEGSTDWAIWFRIWVRFKNQLLFILRLLILDFRLAIRANLPNSITLLAGEGKNYLGSSGLQKIWTHDPENNYQRL